MKHLHSTFLLCLFVSLFANAAPRYWVGPDNGNWSNSANWSDVANGPGGASVPGAQDSVIFSYDTSPLIHVDQSPTIASLQIKGHVTFYASTPVVFTILKTMAILYRQSLKDSTSENVPFNMVFNGATGASADITGDWIFEGGMPIGSRLNAGATFTAQKGAVVTVLSLFDTSPGNNFNLYTNFEGGQVIFKKNTGTITSDKQSLVFTYNTNYVLDNNLDAFIPLASWYSDQLTQFFYSGILRAPAASVLIKNNMDKLQYPEASPTLGRFVIDLPALNTDMDLSFPNGTRITGNMEIYNTNGHTLTLLASTSMSSVVDVEIGVSGPGTYFGGLLVINGSNTKVALARANTDNPEKNFHLRIWKDFNQTGGNFSLQDYNGATGSTTLELRNNMVETGGTFFTNSTSTDAKFIVSMNDPAYVSGPSGSFQSLRNISMSSGTIDNANHKVTLRIEHSVYIINGYESNLNGVALLSPLQVGRLELVRSPLTTTTVNVITINDPSQDAIVIGGPSGSTNYGYSSSATATSYVNGPIRRATNSTQPYFFPTGKGNYYMTGRDFATYANSFLYDSCYVIPTSSTPSVYQAEYFRTGYPDVTVTAPLVGVSQSEYWNFTKISGADAQVKFKFRNPVISSSGSSTLVAAHYENGHWVSVQGSTITPCAITDSFIVSKSLSDFSPFTFGYLNDASTPVVPANLTKGLAYKFYQGTFTALPDFNSLTPVASGVINNIDVSARPLGVDYNYAFKWEGYITIKTPGTYTFQTISDDGSKVYFNTPYCLNAAAIVNNDGVHSAMTATGTINITAPGTYPITVTYFQNYSGQSMQLFWTGPGISQQAIPDSLFSYDAGTTTPGTGTGLNYTYYEGSYNSLPDFSTLTPVKTGNTPNVDINVRPAGVNDNFAFVWEGTIKIATAGTYTFETISDDGSKLFFNGNILVNNDGLHAPVPATGTVTVAAGIYPISISFFEKDGGETMQVYWTGPGIPRQLIPDGVFDSVAVTPQPPTYGLHYKYYEGDFNTLPDFSTLTPVKTGITTNVNIGMRPAGVNDHFAFVWEGAIKITEPGNYYFETVSDDGSKVFINGLLLVDNDGLHAATSVSKSVSLEAGVYPIRIEYFEKDGGETMQLYWSGTRAGRQLIPDDAFILTAPPPAAGISGLNYKYYEGDWNFIPSFTTLTPVKTGVSANVDINVRPSGVNDHFAFIWSGYINLPAPGTYTFETISDDGSRVYFNTPYSFFSGGQVNNDGTHAPQSATGTVTVSAAGKYPITITYFEKDGGEAMQFYWSGPGITRQLVPDAAFSTGNVNSTGGMMSATQSAHLNGSIDRNITMVYPNPFVESFTIDYYHSGSVKNKVSIGLYDLNGRLIYTYQPPGVSAGYNKWTINLVSKNLTPGVYMAEVKVNGIPSKTFKLIKAKSK